MIAPVGCSCKVFLNLGCLQYGLEEFIELGLVNILDLISPFAQDGLRCDATNEGENKAARRKGPLFPDVFYCLNDGGAQT